MRPRWTHPHHHGLPFHSGLPAIAKKTRKRSKSSSLRFPSLNTLFRREDLEEGLLEFISQSSRFPQDI